MSHEPTEKEISPYEFMAREFERLAVLRKMWSAHEVAAILRRYDIERGSGRDQTALIAEAEARAEAAERALANPRPPDA